MKNEDNNQIYETFIQSHPYSNMLLDYDESLMLERVTKKNFSQYSALSDLCSKINTAIHNKYQKPSNYFKTNHAEFIKYCCGSDKEATMLYNYFDKLNLFLMQILYS